MLKVQASTRNQVEGTVKRVREGALNAIVTVCRGNRNPIKAEVSMDYAMQRGIEPGSKAIALVKSTDVLVALGKVEGISAQNQVEGEITSVIEGIVNGTVTIEDECGVRITGTVTNEAIERNGFHRGGRAVAIFNSTDVTLVV